MNEQIEIELGSTIYSRLKSTRMSEAERQVAIAAMRNASRLVDVWEWFAGKLRQVRELSPSQPTLQH
jgi:hypothetical protein